MINNRKDFYKKVAKNITKLRKQKGFTQREVAKALDIGPATINDYEKHRIRIPLDVAVNICEFLKISLYDLTEEDNEILDLYYNKTQCFDDNFNAD